MMSSIVNASKKLHRWLLPQDSEIGVFPYFWLVYLAMFFANFLLYEPPIWHYWAAVAGALVFLFIYFRSFWVKGRELLFYIVVTCLIGTLMSFINPGACVFFIFASAFAANVGTNRQGFLIIAVVCAYLLFWSWFMELSAFFYVPALVFSLLIGTVNVFQRELSRKNAQLKLSQEEVRRLATTAERERIARDLHDLIGHTFSMITMKAQLAKKLFHHDQQRAFQEISELEQISRQSLAEVREAVTGYRQKDLKSELANAKVMLKSADIHFDLDLDAPTLEKQVDATLAFVVREAVTNLVRHSKASRCQLAISHAGDKVKMLFSDNGECEDLREGNGLKGMRERVAELGGQIVIESTEGFSIDVCVPV